ncbi:hypothetical protein TNCV_823401 [Trichonephila clavipes]|nr:hypothetical protein TNCV_823401 [Trichonephila clavipes]
MFTPNWNVLTSSALNVVNWTQKWEVKIRHDAKLVSAHATTLEENLKQQPVCQDSRKGVLSGSGLQIKLVIPFTLNHNPQDSP